MLEFGQDLAATAIIEGLKIALRDLPGLKSNVGMLRIITNYIVSFNEAVPYDVANQIISSIIKQFSIRGNIITYNNSHLRLNTDWDYYEEHGYPYDSWLEDCVTEEEIYVDDASELIATQYVNGFRFRIYPNDTGEKMLDLLLNSYEFLTNFTNKLNRDNRINMQIPVIILGIIAEEKTNNAIISKLKKDKKQIIQKYSEVQRIPDNLTLLTIYLRDRLTITSLSDSLKKRRFSW
jgi:hypothetical protein